MRASAHRGKWGQLTPCGKIDEKLKSENVQKRAVFMFMLYFDSNQGGRCRQRRYADHIFIRIYFRMHHFVVKFSKFSSPQTARVIDPRKRNPADVPTPNPRLTVYSTIQTP